MKKNRTLLMLIIFISLSVSAQETKKDGLSFGFQLNQFQNDFGLGANFSSPSIFNNSVTIRLRLNAMFYEYVNENLKTEWQPYGNIMLGFSSSSYRISDAIALYGEGGIIGILPSSNFSNSSFELGGYGIFGFEFYFSDDFCYFLEVGAVGSGATADKIKTEPIYSNGFIMSVGWKIKL